MDAKTTMLELLDRIIDKVDLNESTYMLYEADYVLNCVIDPSEGDVDFEDNGIAQAYPGQVARLRSALANYPYPDGDSDILDFARLLTTLRREVRAS